MSRSFSRGLGGRLGRHFRVWKARTLLPLLAGRSKDGQTNFGTDRVWRTNEDGAVLLSTCVGGTERLPEGLIVPPRKYIVSDSTFDMTLPGLYQGCTVDGSSAWRRVVIARTTSAARAAMIVAGLGFHGWIDNYRDWRNAASVASRRPLLMTCGHLSAFCMHLLIDQGFEARKAEWFRSGTFNGSDDGHTMIEVFEETLSKWVLVDVDLHRVFVGEAGELLSAHEVWKAGVASVDLREFAGRPLSDVVGIGRSRAAPLAAVFTGDLVHDWYSDVMHHLGLHDDGQIICVGEPDGGSASGRFSFMSEAMLIERHYS